jgi:hypothetical protein
VCAACAEKLRRGEQPRPRDIQVGGQRVPAPQAPTEVGGRRPRRPPEGRHLRDHPRRVGRGRRVVRLGSEGAHGAAPPAFGRPVGLGGRRPVGRRSLRRRRSTLSATPIGALALAAGTAAGAVSGAHSHTRAQRPPRPSPLSLVHVTFFRPRARIASHERGLEPAASCRATVMSDATSYRSNASTYRPKSRCSASIRVDAAVDAARFRETSVARARCSALLTDGTSCRGARRPRRPTSGGHRA